MFGKHPTPKPIWVPSETSSSNAPLSPAIVHVVLHEWDRHDWRGSSDALCDWLNGRWKKAGRQLSREVVCFTLRSNGRDARMGLGDDRNGLFTREPCG
jgi:hypothetical protein